ncbi:MAG: hypothetical protein P4M05_33450 [Bradyrhizobium sp.]|nr:hypothetical protein [Bradyrhizobium sp.]
MIAAKQNEILKAMAIGFGLINVISRAVGLRRLNVADFADDGLIPDKRFRAFWKRALVPRKREEPFDCGTAGTCHFAKLGPNPRPVQILVVLVCSHAFRFSSSGGGHMGAFTRERPRAGPIAVVRLPLPLPALARRMLDGSIRLSDISQSELSPPDIDIVMCKTAALRRLALRQA